MEQSIETRIQELSETMFAVEAHIDEVSKWLNDNMKKAPKGTSFGDVMTTALLGGGLIGMAINRKIRTVKKSSKVIYGGMTADDMGEDIINQLTKLVDCQNEVQRLVANEDERYYGYASRVFQHWNKYYMAWLMFTSYYSTSHKVDYEGQRMTLEKMVRIQSLRQFERLDLDEKTRKLVNKNLR